MIDRPCAAMTSLDLFMQAANEEFTKFERQEAELRKEQRRERAAQLHMPGEK
jgi:hypothetical protein